jgi:hypothetical protein
MEDERCVKIFEGQDIYKLYDKIRAYVYLHYKIDISFDKIPQPEDPPPYSWHQKIGGGVRMPPRRS